MCLTDGQSADSDDFVRPYLQQSRRDIHLVVVGVNLTEQLESQMQLLCTKYGTATQPCKGFYVRSEISIASMNAAFDIISSRIPVSRTFELDGAPTDDECLHFLNKYASTSVHPEDMLLMTFWVRFIYRRVKVFDENESFNYNESHDELGSTLMTIMLEEVHRLISNSLSRDWNADDHTQLIYDFTRNDAPEFRLVCTAPDDMDESKRRALEDLDLPGFSVPTNRDLQQRRTLDRFLSQALNLPLEENVLKCIDDNNFILTLDFTMKLLSIHERVACHTPCVIEGETGVSKTALTRMYAILRNSSIKVEAERFNRESLQDIVQEMVERTHVVQLERTPRESLERMLQFADESVIGNETDAAKDLHSSLLKKCARRSSVFQEVPAEYVCDVEARTTVVVSFLDWFCGATLEPMFFDVNIDSSLTESDIVRSFDPIRKVARKVLPSGALVVVFLDGESLSLKLPSCELCGVLLMCTLLSATVLLEFNTSSILGFCKDIIVDRTLAGQVLEDNIVVIAACNPARKQIARVANLRERDLGKEWASGHYQVAELPPSIAKIKWSFGSLSRSQEKDFILRRMEKIGGKVLPSFLRVSLAEYISESQEVTRSFAERNILRSMIRDNGGELDPKTTNLAAKRARSVVSLRDIQRVFSLFQFFSGNLKISCTDESNAQAQRNCMLLSIGAVYYLRLDGKSRAEFLSIANSLPSEQGVCMDLRSILNLAMDQIIRETDIPEGIAITRGLKENVFMTFVCTLSQTPLMIVGPPGSSKVSSSILFLKRCIPSVASHFVSSCSQKTLAVNIVADNANGEDSPSPFYRKHARLSLFHYQCSKQSTSKELLVVFDQAMQRQARIDSAKHCCFVLMDEAGLPEEEKESLKVLHYLLEGRMSGKAQVGFVAITNHVLDAAKSNRCVMILREEPDEEEMLSISRGVLFDAGGNGYSRAHHVVLGAELFAEKDFALNLCLSYAAMLHDNHKLCWFNTFFGLRDFIHFLKAVRSRSTFEAMKMVTSLRDIVYAVEQNFNGVVPQKLRLITESFVKGLVRSRTRWSDDLMEGAFRDPMHVIQDALMSSNEVTEHSSRTRFKLIIDCTEDDSILRLLSIGGVVDVSRRSLFKLSHMPQETGLEELRLISGVKFAALQGNLAVLSQTESINESFYDLFNQRFQAVTGRDGKVALYANIAVGGISRRSLVRPEFECVIHVKESDMEQLPAPFLNRFEKYRLTISDVLHFGWSSLGGLSDFQEVQEEHFEDGFCPWRKRTVWVGVR